MYVQRLVMSNSRVVGLLLVATLVPSAYAHASGSCHCVTTFYEFEKASIDDSPSNVEALVAAFYETNGPVPLSVQVVYHVNSSNGTDTIISIDPSCPPGKEMWLWVASAVFIFMEPTKLNLCALLTLNYFQNWSPHRAHLYVPSICNISHNQFNFLNDLTSRVQIYAAKHLNTQNIDDGYVLRGCGDEALTTLLPTTQKNNGQGLQHLTEALICIYLAGNLFLIGGVVLVTGLLLHLYGDKITTSVNGRLSYDNYGLFWGCVVLSVVVNGLLTAHAITIITLYLNSGSYDLIVVGWVVLAQLLIIIIASLVFAIYFDRKLDLFIPSIFLWPLVTLTCNQANKACKKFVQCLSLGSLILCLLHVCGRVGMVGLALLALPPTVLFTLLIYIVAAVCTVQFLAIIFTFWKMEKKQWVKHRIFSNVLDLGQALTFTCLFFTVLCFGLLISAIGALANYGTFKSSLYSIFAIFLTPAALTAVVWTLRKIGALWLHTNSPVRQELNGNENEEVSERDHGQRIQEEYELL